MVFRLTDARNPNVLTKHSTCASYAQNLWESPLEFIPKTRPHSCFLRCLILGHELFVEIAFLGVGRHPGCYQPANSFYSMCQSHPLLNSAPFIVKAMLR